MVVDIVIANMIHAGVNKMNELVLSVLSVIVLVTAFAMFCIIAIKNKRCIHLWDLNVCKDCPLCSPKNCLGQDTWEG